MLGSRNETRLLGWVCFFDKLLDILELQFRDFVFQKRPFRS